VTNHVHGNKKHSYARDDASKTTARPVPP
jgi:hypothetical protein